MCSSQSIFDILLKFAKVIKNFRSNEPYTSMLSHDMLACGLDLELSFQISSI